MKKDATKEPHDCKPHAFDGTPKVCRQCKYTRRELRRMNMANRRFTHKITSRFGGPLSNVN